MYLIKISDPRLEPTTAQPLNSENPVDVEASRVRKPFEGGRQLMLSEEQIKHMAERFLAWKLPDPWHPDAGIKFEPFFNVEYNERRGLPPQRHEPTGTNLFDYTQAEAMVRHMLEGLPA